ncbi:MAG: glycoside hydrolase family 9 protein [bacterium]|nr:glycoside hydrolase family 9 protein [bacterium]MCM1376319.1 glycoside hydrolase family 9 protein [Muribaculum sp.]
MLGQTGAYKRIILYLLCFCLAAGHCGCGWVEDSDRYLDRNAGTGDAQALQAEGAAGQDAFRLLSEAELDYPLPLQYPGVWVSLGGYDSKGIKEVFFRGRRLPDTFRVMDASTGQCVYTGSIGEKRYDDVSDEYNSYGEFTDFTDVGEYYIECDIIGRSYPFVLQEEQLGKRFEQAALLIRQQSRESLTGAEDQEIREMLQQVLVTLLSYEFYSDVYEDGDGNQIPDILEYMTETVRGIVRLQQSAEPDELTYELAAALAKYSYLYQKYDAKYATETIQLAAGLWQQAERAGDAVTENRARLLAAAELYRATGQRKYAQVVQASNGGLVGKYEQGDFDRYDYLAAITYISTKQRVELELCSRLIRVLMNRAEEIAGGIPRLDYQESDMDGMDIDEILWNMVVLSVVEYVITNYEYAGVIEDQYYFLWGRNARAHCYWEHDICNSPVRVACYLMMLSEMMTNG